MQGEWDLFRHVKSRVQALLAAVGVPRVKGYRPAFTPEAAIEWIEACRAGPNIRAHGAASGAKHAPEQLVDLWAIAGRPCFFLAFEEVPEFVAAFPDKWKKRLLRQARRDCEVGLPIYGENGPRLDEEFPWSKLPGAEFDDLLLKIRPHRFAFLVRHCIAALEGQQAPEKILKILTSWQADARTLRGSRLAYASNLLVIQRVMAVLWAINLLVHRIGQKPYQALVSSLSASLAADIQFLFPQLGRSAPNNHLLADRFAGWLLPAAAPEFCPADINYADSEAAWLAELERQVYPDGTGFEHSSHYHEVACEMAICYVAISKRNGLTIPNHILHLIRNMLHFQASLCGIAGHEKHLGNGAEDALLGLEAAEGEGAAALREVYRTLFQAELESTADTARGIEKAYFLCAGKMAPRWKATSSQAEVLSWRDGGYVLLNNPATGHRLLFRSGPAVARPSFPGHAHADLLSVMLDYRGLPMIEDPGTYTYRYRVDPAEPMPLRAWFDGPWAHSGPLLAGEHPFGGLTADFRAGGAAHHGVAASQ